MIAAISRTKTQKTIINEFQVGYLSSFKVLNKVAVLLHAMEALEGEEV
jgi:HSP90 family molecular chaperone